MVVRELFVKLGLQQDAASFAEGFAVVELLKKGMETLKEKAHEAKDWLEEQVRATAEAGEEASHTAQRVGIHADQLQRLAYAASLSNVSMEELAGGLQHLARLGVRDTNAKVMQLADQFEKMPDSGRKTALAMQYFGRGLGTKLIPLLNKGSEGIRELMGEADDLGIVMSKEDLEATEKYSEAIRRLEASGRGLRNTVVLPLLGLLTKFANLVTSNVKAFREWYKTIPQVVANLKALALALATVAALVALSTVAWQALAEEIVIQVLAALLALEEIGLAGIARLIAGWLAAAAPWMLMAIGIGLVILLLQDFYTFLSGGDSVLGRVIKAWKTQFGTFGDFLHDLWTTIKYEAGELWDWLGTQIKKIPGVQFLIGAAEGAVTGGATAGIGGAAVGAMIGTAATIPRVANSSTSNSSSSTYSPTVNVTVHGDADGKKIGRHVEDALDAHHKKIMREAHAAAP